VSPLPPASGAAAVRVLYVDADVLVVDKPPGVPSVPARTPADPPAVVALLREVYGPLEAAHRLDRDTSGLLVLSRSTAARVALGRAFESRTVSKRYEAVVEGVPATSSGEIHLPLAADPDRPPRHRVDPIAGRIAVTRWRLLEHGDAADGPRSWLELEPLTGRSHQLRVHLAWLGMPIVGDRLYGLDDRLCVHTGARPAAERLALHAAGLIFPHPADGRPIFIESPSGFRVNGFRAEAAAALLRSTSA